MHNSDNGRQEGPASGAATVADVIAIVAERIHYAEGRRTNFTIAASVLIAGGVALFTSVYDKVVSKLAWFALIGASISAILVGAAVLVAYAIQTNRYPWTQATNTWKWFYRDALPDASKFEIGWLGLISFKKAKPRIQDEYNRQLPIFQKKLNALKLPGTSYQQDLQQLYVLHINDKYKNLHLSQLRAILGWGIPIIILSMVVGAIYGTFEDYRFGHGYSNSFHTNGYSIRADWHRARLGDGSQALVTARLDNLGQAAIVVPTWQASDRNGHPLPAEVQCTSVPGSMLMAGESLIFSCVVKPYEQAYISSLSARRP